MEIKRKVYNLAFEQCSFLNTIHDSVIKQTSENVRMYIFGKIMQPVRLKLNEYNII